jgi:1,4-dihydroxy-2-naphthoate octaprenyltransferase
MQLSCIVHGIGMVFAYILHIWLYVYGYLSTTTFLLMLIPAPIGLRQVRTVLAHFNCAPIDFSFVHMHEKW